METTPQAQLAVLIDADNANAKRIDGLLAEVAKYGRATTKRAYGDWTNTHLGSWKQTLARHAIQPMQQFSNTRGKNSTDSALIIDAMDLLYTERFDGFCIVSSDSDFTRLASRIREAGLTVYGFGERKTPQPFVRACDRFIFVEVLREGEADEESVADTAARNSNDRNRPPQGARKPLPPPAAPPPASGGRPAAAPVAQKPVEAGEDRPSSRGAPIDDPALLGPLCAAVADAGDDDGWAGLGAVGSLLGKRMPEFDPRNYGRKKLSDLFAAIPIFEVDERGEPGRSRALFVREKRVRDAVESKPEVKPDVKAYEPRPESKPEAKPAAKPELMPEAKIESTPLPIVAATPAAEPKADPLRAPHQPKPPQRPPQPKAAEPRSVLVPSPVPAAAPAPAKGSAADADWAPRRDVRRPSWAVAVPVEGAEPVVVAPVVEVKAAPVETAPAPIPAATPVPEVAAIAPAKPVRKTAAKKAVAAVAPAAAPVAVKAAEPAAAAAKPRSRKPAAAPPSKPAAKAKPAK